MWDDTKQNEFRIMVNHEKLKEMQLGDGQVYVEMPLFSNVAYGAEFIEEVNHGKLGVEKHVQKWPVCPYTVWVKNHTAKVNFAQLYIDGQKVAMKYIHPHSTGIFEGIPTEQGIQELLFSLPRYATQCEKENSGGRSLPQCFTAELGTIKIQWQTCEAMGSAFNPNYREHITTSFQQANKTDAGATGEATRVALNADGISVGAKAFASTTRVGKVVKLNEARSCTVTRYDRIGDPWSARVLYRTREYLMDIGVIKQEEVETPEENADRLRRRENKKRRRIAKSKASQGTEGPPMVVVVGGDDPLAVPASQEEHH